eukprot:gene261-280_t
METKIRSPHSVGYQLLGMTLDDDFYEMALARPPSSFPLLNNSRHSITIRNDIDYSLLKPDDPFFLDMPWPTEVGPAATAFSRHMAWKRRLSDGERKRWQRWAIYRRNADKNLFRYSIEDYIKQNLLVLLDKRGSSINPASQKKSVDGAVWSSLAKGFRSVDEEEVTSVVKAYYSAFNRKGLDELRMLILPDDETEISFPGFGKARGHYEIEKLLHKVMRESKPLGKVDARIISVKVVGNVAVVYSIETVGPNPANRSRKSKPAATSTKTSSHKKVVAITTLRYANKQWRILMRNCAPFSTSAFTGNHVKVGSRLRNTVASSVGRNTSGKKSSVSTADIKGKSSWQDIKSILDKAGVPVSSVMNKKNKNGEWEKVLAIDDLNSLKTRADGSKPSIREALESLQGLLQQGKRTNGISVVDPKTSVSKQTIQALRYLNKTGRLTKEEKDDLVADVIDCIAEDGEAIVETSFKVIYADRAEDETFDNDASMTALDDFADQCQIALQLLYTSSHRRRTSA